MKRRTLPERIDEALGGRPMPYFDLALALWAPGSAWRGATKGGPPGCYMALSAALRRGGFTVEYAGRSARLVHPRKTG